MINVTVKQLKYFDALAKLRHFGRAAEFCAVSQPALSVQIKELENDIGAPLVERQMRPIALTPLGERIARHAEIILAEVAAIEDTARSASEVMQGPLRLGVIPTVAPYLLPKILTALGTDFPELEVHVRESLTHQLIAEIFAGRIDAALLAMPVSEPNLTEYALFDEELVLARPLAAADDPVPGPAALRNMPLLLLEDGHCFRDQALSFCSMSGDAPRDGLEASALSTLVQMVGAGHGVTLLPQMAVSVERHAAPIDVVSIPDPAPERTLGLVWRSGNALEPHLIEVAKALKSHAAPDTGQDKCLN